MKALSFLRSHRDERRTTPHPEPMPVGVNVTLTEREAKPDGIEWNTPDPQTVAHIDAHLPNRPSANLIAARHALQLAAYHRFLTDPAHATPAPDMAKVIAALEFAADHILDGVVIA